MIPIAQVTHWRQIAPWGDDIQVEQDLILSRIIVEIFSSPFLAKELAFRGGTALHKLFFSPPARYSEDIDLVRTSKGEIKDIITALRNCLDPLLGGPKTIRNFRSFKLVYHFTPEVFPNSRQRIKIEINTRESFAVLDRFLKDFSVQSDWFTGETQVNTFQFEELIATKLRALYERSKGRDVFDLWLALRQKDFHAEKSVEVFLSYMQKENKHITRKLFEENLILKLKEHSFLDDIGQLLSPELKISHSSPFKTENNSDDRLIENSHARLVNERWNLIKAAKEVKDKFLIYLPR
ncbi:MAG: nucleotidyl transferase AbiEii/AbiGii toxin family protein [Gammaproteobacteria bacterium]|jgi:predicted nucleotidyltransferase component of viral defense system|nr:nucleotidyl transferase AbiEii/AbiGii toxin family protein [Gammaproteobacteria bacterium]